MNKMRTLFKYLLLTLLFIQPLCAQTYDEIQTIRRRRLKVINIHNLGIGIEAGGCTNYFVAPKVYYRFGSSRNLINVDAGFRYMLYNPVRILNRDFVSSQYFTPFIASNINYVRWVSGSAYVGAELLCSIPTNSSYYQISSSRYLRDKSIGKYHTNISGRVGFRLKQWDVSLFASYSFAPSFNQKYIFETPSFNYYNVRSQLYSRYNFGLSLSYIIQF
jgi:hypothetical protein